MAALAHLINHAWQHMGPTWGARLTMGLGHTSGEGGRAIISGSEQDAGQGRVQHEKGGLSPHVSHGVHGSSWRAWGGL